jgi:hypothetical protein
VWYGQSVILDDKHKVEEETQLKTFVQYEEIYLGKVNDKIKVVDSIKTLNEKLRSQFVGTCLLALKNELVYENI